MKKLLSSLLFALLLLPLAVKGQCGTDVLKASDADGNTYTTLKVGPHCWTQFNLKTKAEGSFIYKSDMYPDTTANLSVYGRLYNWYTAMNVQPGQTPVVGEHNFVQGICPEGWHLPNDVEVAQLMTNTAPTLHDVHYWLVPGTNTTTYTMRPGGFYNAGRDYGENLCGNSFMWTAQSLDESSPSIVWSDCHCDYILVDKATAHDGMSVRCVYKIYRGEVTTDSVKEITDQSATLYGTVAFSGYDEEYKRGFVYGTDPNNLDQWAVESSTASEETAPFNKEITGLTVATTYYYQAYIINDFDTAWGEIKDFKTLQMQVTTDSANNITHYTATLHGTLTHLSYPSVNAGFKYGTSESALTSIVAKEDAMTATGLFSCDITGLTANTQYYYTAFAANGTDTVYGEVKDFTTPVMFVTTDSANTITKNGATLYGNVTDMGGMSEVNAGFKYGTSEDALTTIVAKEDAMTATGLFNYGITGLTANTQYYYKAFAANGTDTVYGEVKNFKTLSINPCPNAATVTDVDNNVYNTVQIGNQCWMAENLRTTKYANGTAIANGGTTSSITTAYRYFPGGDTNNVVTYGHLYNWKAVMGTSTSSKANPSGVQGICPDGWHVPSDAEWTQLTDYVKSQSGYKCNVSPGNIAKALASATGWSSSPDYCDVGNDQSSNNATGFSAVPAGFYNESRSCFNGFGGNAYFWSATRRGIYAYYRSINYSDEYVTRDDHFRGNGYSVRCVRDPLTVVTTAVSSITANSAICGGNVLADGGSAVTARGVCWSTSQNPTTADGHTTDGSGTGSFNSSIMGLSGSTTYYVRAYATNGEGTAYGSQVSFTTNPSFTCGTYTVKDVDNNEYNTVKIGNQCWMKENLRTNVGGGVYPKYPSGHTREGQMVDDSLLYGRLYTWTAMMKNAGSSNNVPSGVQGICPAGWHVPSDAEWTQLTTYVNTEENGYRCNGDGTIAKALASKTGWSKATGSENCNVGKQTQNNDATGFSALPAGYYSGSYVLFGDCARFWSATQSSNNKNSAYYRSLTYNSASVTKGSFNKGNGFSVRCVRDDMSVTTDSANTVTKNSAKLYGNVTSLGTYDQVNAGFKYGTSEDALTSIVAKEDAMTAAGQFSCDITGLTANTTYYYQAFVANETDTVKGEVKNFTTAADIVTDTIVFFANGGIGTMDTMFVTRGDTVLNANTYTHGGNWHFDGWNTEADGSGTQYADQDAITTNGNLTLYAQWHTWCTGIPKTSVNEFGTSRIDSVKDIDNNKYNVVQIGDQCWMAQNLRTTKYADGTSISLGSTTSTETAYHYYPTGSSSNVSKYGYLYNWKAVMGNSTSSETNPSGVQGICPKGWHVPSDTEWTQLTNYVSSQSEYVCESINTYNAKALASTTGWNSSSNTCVPGNNPSDNNATGFSAVPAGYYSGGYGSFGDDAHFWSATQYYNSYAYSRYVDYNYADVHKYNYEEYYGFSVRCLRDPMTVTTDSTNTITKNSAKLYGNVTNMGGFAEVNAGFRYGQHPDYMTFRTERTVSSTGSFNAELTNISPNTTYYFQSYAATATDTAWASDTLTFTTLTNPCSVASIRGNERGTGKQIDSVKDHEDNWYKVVQIGSQCWLRENMRASTEPGSSTHIALNTDASLTEPRIYSTDSGYVARYGYLYNFPAAMNTSSDHNHFTYPHRGICPEGWHVPTKDDWDLLAATAGVPDHLYVPGTTEFTDGLGKLTGGTDWITSTWRTSPGCYNYIYRDSTGFSARPASCYYDGKIENVGESAYFWTSSEDDYYLHIYYSYGAILYGSGEAHSSGFSIRCVRDAEVPAAMSVTTDSANTVTNNGATLYGNVTDMGGKSEVKTGFKYGTSESTLTSIVSDGVSTTAPGMFSYGITGLTANTQYYYKAFAANGTDTVYGEVKNFKTLSINPCPNAATVTDVDGNEYNTVQIGSQCWMKENLRTTKYADGTPISLGNSKSTSTAYRYYPNNDSNTVSTYGYLYNWRAAMRSSSSSENNPSGVQGICPTGWHLPSDAEWTQLTDYVSSQSQYRCNGNASFISKSLAATSGWRRDHFACAIGNYQFLNNATDFSGVPSGDYSGDYALFANSAYFWSTTQPANKHNDAFIRLLYYNSESVFRNYDPIDFGFGVRCLRN